MINKYQELTNDVLYKIQKHYNDRKIQLRFSPFSLFQWNAYNMKVLYYFDSQDYFFFLNFTKKDSKVHKLLKPNCFPGFIIFSKNFITEEYVRKLKILINENDCCVFFSEKLDENLIEKLEANLFDAYPARISNYIYETKKFVGFPGKKMQKKRNFLNGFFRDNPNFSIEKINEENIKYAIEFINNQIKDEKNYEFNSYVHIYDSILKHSDMINGSILKVDGKIVGATIGIINGDTYEIIIEKALFEYRGSYQALISENLKLHKIKTTYIDRQDDLENENLIKSKESYNPIEKIMFVAYKI